MQNVFSLQLRVQNGKKINSSSVTSKLQLTSSTVYGKNKSSKIEVGDRNPEKKSVGLFVHSTSVGYLEKGEGGIYYSIF